MSQMKFPTLVEVGLAIYISAPANTITIPATKLNVWNQQTYVATKHNVHRKRVNFWKIDGSSQRRQTKGLCRKHGGQSRCTVADCYKTNQGGGHCRAHGGEKRCLIDCCNKGTESLSRAWSHSFMQRPRLHTLRWSAGFCKVHFKERLSKSSHAT